MPDFDYCGTEAVRVVRRGYHVTLVNSNPATLVTDPKVVEATHITCRTADLPQLQIVLQCERSSRAVRNTGAPIVETLISDAKVAH